jgi:hypothetical protein
VVNVVWVDETRGGIRKVLQAKPGDIVGIGVIEELLDSVLVGKERVGGVGGTGDDFHCCCHDGMAGWRIWDCCDSIAEMEGGICTIFFTENVEKSSLRLTGIQCIINPMLFLMHFRCRIHWHFNSLPITVHRILIVLLQRRNPETVPEPRANRVLDIRWIWFSRLRPINMHFKRSVYVSR